MAIEVGRFKWFTFWKKEIKSPELKIGDVLVAKDDRKKFVGEFFGGSGYFF